MMNNESAWKVAMKLSLYFSGGSEEEGEESQ
jgi:hypothetical protein